MSKAIGTVLMMGLSEEEKDDDKMLKLRAEAENYARMANQIDTENYINQSNDYLNVNTLENRDNNDIYPIVREDKRNQFNSGVENLVQSTNISKNNNSAIGQILGATRDLGESYINMVNANLQSNQDMLDTGTTIDNYYHCIGNYDAASRGNFGAATAAAIGFGREAGDYIKNITSKDRSITEANKDFLNDLTVNSDGREMARSNKYTSALEACDKYRPEEYDPLEKLKYYLRKYKR